MRGSIISTPQTAKKDQIQPIVKHKEQGLDQQASPFFRQIHLITFARRVDFLLGRIHRPFETQKVSFKS